MPADTIVFWAGLLWVGRSDCGDLLILLALGCETFARVRMSVRIGNSAREIRLVRKQLCCATPSDRNGCERECKIQGVME